MAKHDECRDIEDLKQEYEILRAKYNLPDFKILAEEFDVERVAEKETSFVLRNIRRAMNDKISAYLRLFETLNNPSSAPMFIFSMLKNLKEAEKDKMKEIYKKFAKLEIDVMKLDTVYDEKKEADFIKAVAGQWDVVKKEVYSLLENLGKDFDISSNSVKGGYFG